MRKFKRVASGILASVLAMSMMACGGDDGTSGRNENKPEEIKPYREALADEVDAVKVAEITENRTRTYIFMDKELKTYEFTEYGYMTPEFSNDRCLVYTGGPSSYAVYNALITLDNKVIFEYDAVYNASTDDNTYYKVKKDDKWGLVDKDGNVIIPIQYDSIDDENIYFYDCDEQPVIFIAEYENADGKVEKREYWTEQGVKLETTENRYDFKEVYGAYENINNAIIYAEDSSYNEYYFDYATGKKLDTEKYEGKAELVYVKDDQTVVFCDKNLNEIKSVDIENLSSRNDKVTVYKDWVVVFLTNKEGDVYKEEKTQIYDRKGNLLNELDFCLSNSGYGEIYKYVYGGVDYYIHWNKERYEGDEYSSVRVLDSKGQLTYEKKLPYDDDTRIYTRKGKYMFVVHEVEGSDESDLHTAYIVDLTTGKELEDKYELAYAESYRDCIYYNVTKSQSEYFLPHAEIKARTGRVEEESNLSYEFNYSYKEVDGKTEIIDDYTGKAVCTVDADKKSISFFPEIECYKVNGVVYTFDGNKVYSESEASSSNTNE